MTGIRSDDSRTSGRLGVCAVDALFAHAEPVEESIVDHMKMPKNTKGKYGLFSF
jgi:hypothetical protein